MNLASTVFLRVAKVMRNVLHLPKSSALWHLFNAIAQVHAIL